MSAQNQTSFSSFIFIIFLLIFIFLCGMAIVNRLEIPAAVGMVLILGLLILHKRIPLEWQIRIKNFASIMFRQPR